MSALIKSALKSLKHRHHLRKIKKSKTVKWRLDLLVNLTLRHRLARFRESAGNKASTFIVIDEF